MVVEWTGGSTTMGVLAPSSSDYTQRRERMNGSRVGDSVYKLIHAVPGQQRWATGPCCGRPWN